MKFKLDLGRGLHIIDQVTYCVYLKLTHMLGPIFPNLSTINWPLSILNLNNQPKLQNYLIQMDPVVKAVI